MFRTTLALSVCALFTVLAAAPDASAQSRRDSELHDAIVQDILDLTTLGEDGDELPLDSLKFFIEFNETDEDIGVQCVLGGEPYKVLRAYDPFERQILLLRPQRRLRDQGMSDFFFESAEPELSEFSMDDFLHRFPEGLYEFETITLENEEQDGDALLTHMIPAGPEIVYPLEGDVVDPSSLVVMWEPVTMTTAFNPPQVPVNIVGYQVIVTGEDPERVCSIDLPANATSVEIPASFLEPGKEYELEILAVEESDNQTISLLFFETAD